MLLSCKQPPLPTSKSSFSVVDEDWYIMLSPYYKEADPPNQVVN